MKPCIFDFSQKSYASVTYSQEKTHFSNDIDFLRTYPKEVFGNKEFLKKLVKENGLALQFASEEFKNDPNIAGFAVLNNVDAFEYIGEELKNDTHFLKKLIEYQPEVFKKLSDQQQKDKSFVLDVIKNNASLLKYVRNDLKRDTDILIAALQQSPSAFYAFSKKMRKKIGDSDPLQYLISFSLQEKLQHSLDNKLDEENTTNKKYKI